MTGPHIYYFDNNATTRPAPEAIQAMLPFLKEHWGNPSSPHQLGREAARHLGEARAKVSALINAAPEDVVFTSCGTEGINTALHSAVVADPSRQHVITTQVEHSASLEYCEWLEKRGADVTYVPVGVSGALDLGQLEDAIRPDTAMVSVMWANNETGFVFPIFEISQICQRKGIPFHTDAVQAAGRVPIDVKDVNVDFLSLSGHKCHAPKGIGLLYVNPRARCYPYVIGGPQEFGKRSGTESVAHIVAFGESAAMMRSKKHEIAQHLRSLRDRLESRILAEVSGARRNGAAEPRLPNTTSIAFPGIESEAVVVLLDQLNICVSTGAACNTGAMEPSHVLIAMGLDHATARSTVRFSVSIYNTVDEVEYVADQVGIVVSRLRGIA